MRGHRRARVGECKGKGKAGRKTLLWVDDHTLGLMLYKSVFESRGFRVLTASRAREGLQILASHLADAAVVDYEMPGMDGGRLASKIKQSYPGLPVIMYSGSASIPKRVQRLVDALCMKAGARQELFSTINRVLSHKAAMPLRPSSGAHV